MNTNKNEYIIINNRFRISREVLNRATLIDNDYFDWGFEGLDDWNQIEEKAFDFLGETVDNKVPVYSYNITYDFSELSDERVDDLVSSYDIEFKGDFSKFKQTVLYYHMYEIASEELGDILESMEEIELETEDLLYDFRELMRLYHDFNLISDYKYSYMEAYENEEHMEIDHLLRLTLFSGLLYYDKYLEVELLLEDFIDWIDEEDLSELKVELYNYYRECI